MKTPISKDDKRCPICGKPYSYNDPKIIYHVEYKPEITTDTCRGCNYAEFLIRRPDIKTSYYMKAKMKKVRQWTLHNRPLIIPIETEKPLTAYNVIDATKFPGKTSGARNINAMIEATRMAKEHPEIESTYFKYDITDRKHLADDGSSDDDTGGIIEVDD